MESPDPEFRRQVDVVDFIWETLLVVLRHGGWRSGRSAGAFRVMFPTTSLTTYGHLAFQSCHLECQKQRWMLEYLTILMIG